MVENEPSRFSQLHALETSSPGPRLGNTQVIDAFRTPHFSNSAETKRSIDSGIGWMKDFQKLDKKFESLNYGVGVFVNIDSYQTRRDEHAGRFPDRVIGFAVRLEGAEAKVINSCPQVANGIR